MFKILKTKGTYIALLVCITLVGTWFLLITSGTQQVSSLAQLGDQSCSSEKTLTQDTKELCEKKEESAAVILASLEEYFLSPTYEKPSEEPNPEVPLVRISTQKVHTSPFSLLLKKVKNSQLADASRALISGDEESILDGIDSISESTTVWDLAQMIIPPEYVNMVVEYREESDGPRHMLAYVEPVDARGESWVLVVDPVDAYATDGGAVFNDPQKLITTLVHEFGHALSLNETQINHSARGACDPGIYEALEGCSYPDAYMQKFVSAFWLDILDEFLVLTPSQKLYFYGKYKDRFVNSYAATDPGEDFAETFAYFVVTKQRGTDTVASQKIEHFYTDPEFVRIREYMRQKIVIVMDQLS